MRFGSHTYSFINAENQRIWVKFHLRTLQGVIKNLTDQEAEAIVAKDRESHQRDLQRSIERAIIEMVIQIQLMTEEEAGQLSISTVLT